MAKIRMRKLFLSALSVLMLGCLTVGATGTTKNVNADAITPTGVADSNFWVEGGAYARTDRADSSVDGVAFHIVPDEDGGDVTLTLKGGNRRYSGTSKAGSSAGSWWGGRLMAKNDENVAARMITYRSPVDQDYEISFITGGEGLYVSLTSDIEIRGNVPYVIGSDTKLTAVQWSGNAWLKSAYINFKPTNIPGVVGTNYNGTVCTLQGDVCVSDSNDVAINILNAETLAKQAESIPDEYKERYTVDWATRLCTDMAVNDTILEIKYFDVEAEGTTTHIRSLNAKNYYAGDAATLNFVEPRQMLVQKDSSVIFEDLKEFNVNDLIERWTPAADTPQSAGLSDVYFHTYSNYDCVWTNTSPAAQSNDTTPTATGKTSDGYYSFKPANRFNTTDNTYYAVLKNDTSDGTTAGAYGTWYLYARWDILDATNKLVEAKETKLCADHEYALTDIVDLKDITDYSASDVTVSVYANATDATGTATLSNVAMNAETAKIKLDDNYDTTNGNVSIFVVAKKDGLTAPGSAFTFDVSGHQEVAGTAVAPTCENTGLTEGKVCSVCGEILEEQTPVAAKGHAYGTPSYVWADDNSTCTATAICANDEEHVLTETVNVASSVTQNKTCEDDELSTLTATFTNSVFTTQTKENVKTADKGHTYGEVTYTWSADNSTCTATRTCANDKTHVETETVNAVKTVTQAATTSKVELSKFEATFTNAAFAKQTKENVQTGDMLPATSEPDSSAPDSSTPDNSTTDSDSSASGSGCSGSIGSLGGVVLVLAMAVVFVAVKRRKEN